MPQIPLIEDLTKGPIPPGSNILVEFDPTSQWYNASLTIAAGWIRSGGVASYNVFDHAPEDARSHLKRLRLDVETLEREEKLRIIDWYSIQLGQKSKEKYANNSLKVADHSIIVRKQLLAASGSPYLGSEYPHLDPDVLRISDDEPGILLRFNDEKSYIDYWRIREIPLAAATKSTLVVGTIKGVYSEYVYKSLEASADGVIDFKLEEESGEARNFMRIRSMRSVGYDSRWHRLKIGNNLE